MSEEYVKQYPGEIEPVRDCPTCRHSFRADCRSPKYIALNYEGRKKFWEPENLDQPCHFWEEAESSLREGGE